MRELEQATVESGATWAGLMEQAGWGVAQVALAHVGRGKRALVLVGPGNNGGDGLVIARHLHDAGVMVQLYLWRRPLHPDDANRTRCRSRDIPEYDAAADPDQAQLTALLAACDLVVDALLGMGATRPAEGELAAIIRCVNRADPALVLAVDLPTGVDADSGAVGGAAIQADVTVATGMLKRGVVLSPARAYAGRLALAEIGIPAILQEGIMSEKLTAEYVARLLPSRPADAHKGTFGKVMVIGGSLRYPGAAVLTCSGAQRSGAGLVTLAAGRTVLGVSNRPPEITLLPLAEGDWGALGPAAVDELSKELDGYAALVIGPGMGKADPTKEFVRRLFGLEQPKSRARVGFLTATATTPDEEPKPVELPPTVIDADGLNLLAEIEDWPERMPKGRMVFTPHPGEMRRLLGVEELQSDLITTASEAAQQWGQVVVLKGGTTVIAAPDGRTLVYDGQNPALASAGTGDVLAGLIGGLIAQGLTPADAAALGVYLHGSAGNAVREQLGDSGTVASDMLPHLPRAIRALRK
ncbi:MAG: NAD(P)H-hydrate dehydratase [Oscillochloris sp.]|nr:NAD(P)H-hydrate dehydratase [Oscillochloris sp.]